MIISQSQWGSSRIYDDGELRGRWDPQYIIVHWGGMTRERGTFELATSTLRGWQAYHIRKGWQDIGYNYAIDELGNMYRLRGENSSGATSGRAPNGQRWGEVGVSIVWIGGKGDEDGPSAAALARLDSYVAERGLPVIGHQETGKATSCPGQDWLDHIHGIVKPPSEAHMLIAQGHPVGATVKKIQEALINWDPDALPRWGVDSDFGGETEQYIREYQEDHGLPVTGAVDDETAWHLA